MTKLNHNRPYLRYVDNLQRGLSLGAADYLIKINMTREKIKTLLNKHIVDYDARVNMQVE